MTNDEDGPVSNEMVQKAQLKKMVAICNEMKEMTRNDPDGLSECLAERTQRFGALQDLIDLNRKQTQP